MVITQDIRTIKDFGLMYGWPSMILKRNGNKITRTIGKGKHIWRNVVLTSSLRKPYNNAFIELLDAVKRVDVWKKDG